jgi:hypothetical protein
VDARHCSSGSRRFVIALAVIAAALVAVPFALASQVGGCNGNGNGNPHVIGNSTTNVNGAVYTSTDPAVDGTGRCKNGPNGNTPTIDCNIYTGKQYVWLNGGPPKNGLSPAGVYFFAVVKPGDQPNPNDATVASPNPDNYSCPAAGCSDPYTNRMFTVGSTGEITSYTGTHQSDTTTYPANGILIRLCAGTSGAFCPPYFDTTNPGGEYAMVVCYLGPSGGPLLTTVDPSNC